jgi:hypothetical protein
MSTIFTCIVCSIFFNDKRSFVSHQNTQGHKKKAGESFQGFTCELCGRQFSRTYDITRHQQQGGCLGLQATAAQQPVTSNKRKFHSDRPGIPNQRIRTASPTCRYDAGDSTLTFDTRSRDIVYPWILEQGGSGAIPSSQNAIYPWILEQDGSGAIPTRQGRFQSASDSGTTTSNPIPQDGAVDPDLSTVDVLAETDFDGAQENTHPLPLAYTGAAGSIATSLISTADQVESLTRAVERFSMQLKQRSSFAPSIATGYSPASQTRSSIRSYFMNHSLGSIRLSRCSDSSQRSSKRSFKRASTVPSEMTGPMLEPIDEELVNSRESGNRLGCYVPSVFQEDRRTSTVRQERFWHAIQEGDTEEVADILASWTSTIDINCPDDDTSGWSPLITATVYDHSRIVALLLDQSGIDVSYRDTMGLTAHMYAQKLNHSTIEDIFAEYESSVREYERELELENHERHYRLNMRNKIRKLEQENNELRRHLRYIDKERYVEREP